MPPDPQQTYAVPPQNQAGPEPVGGTAPQPLQPLPQNQAGPEPVGGTAPQPLQPLPQNLPPVHGPQAIGKPVTPKNPNSTQNALLISEIRDGLVILNDGSMRAAVACRSINFDLMSAREREAVEYSYQNFLNSLYFPLQIFIRSQRVDLGPYLERLEKVRRDQDNMLLGVLMDDYIAFITALAQETNIMDKSFFVIVPYYPAGDIGSAVNSSKNLLANLFAPSTQQRIRIDDASYNKAKDELRNRINTVVSGLQQIGVRSIQLDTKALGELFYNVYNPDTAVREPIANFDSLMAPIITKGQGAAPQPQLDKELT